MLVTHDGDAVAAGNNEEQAVIPGGDHKVRRHGCAVRGCGRRRRHRGRCKKEQDAGRWGFGEYAQRRSAGKAELTATPCHRSCSWECRCLFAMTPLVLVPPCLGTQSLSSTPTSSSPRSLSSPCSLSCIHGPSSSHFLLSWSPMAFLMNPSPQLGKAAEAALAYISDHVRCT